MLGMSLDTWTNILVLSLGVAAFAAVILGVSTYAVNQLQKQESLNAQAALEQYKVSAKRDSDIAIGKAQADADIKINATREEARTQNKLLEKAAADANKSAADANERASQAEERLAVLWSEAGRRIVNQEKFLEALGTEPHGIVEIVYGDDDQDSWSLSIQLRALIEKAGWTVSVVAAVPMQSILKQVIVVGQGVRVFAHSISQEEIQSIMMLSVGKTPSVRTPYVLMEAALIKGLQGGAVGGTDPSLPGGTLRLVIAPR
jgi:hypothetical protein